MSRAAPLQLQVFDPQQPVEIIARKLPHWSQPGTIAFITWRTWDSIPRDVLSEWLEERAAWLRRHGINSKAENAEVQFRSLTQSEQNEFRRILSERWHANLDVCHGRCVLKAAKLAQMVAESLHHFDGDRYQLTDFVVMPNHVHLLAAFPDETAMLKQCDSWKHFTAVRINNALFRKGRFWQQDDFDHLVRSAEQFEYLRR